MVRRRRRRHQAGGRAGRQAHGSQGSAARLAAWQAGASPTALAGGARPTGRSAAPLPSFLPWHTHTLPLPAFFHRHRCLQELGVQILTDLQRQRETILHSRDTLHTVDTHVSRSRQILQSMSRRILQNKVIMWGIILLLLGAIGLVVWAKF